MNFHLHLIFLCSYFVILPAVRVKDNIYVPLYDSQHACFRLLNGTHQTGCQSKESGSTGIVYIINSTDDVKFILNDLGDNAPFIAVMRLNFFSQTSLLVELRNSKKISGILLFNELNATDESIKFSEDNACPNDINSNHVLCFCLYNDDKEYSHCQKVKWNSAGNAMRFLDWNIPIFLMQNYTEIEYVESCYNNYNKPKNGQPRPWPLCALEMFMFNQAAGNAVTCLRRNNLFNSLEQRSTRICDPLEDENLFAFVPATNKSRPLTNSSVVVLAARMDSFSLFSQSDPGAISALSNVIAMLAIAEAIGKNRQQLQSSSPDRHLLLVLFNGESLDYIGSSSMAWNMNLGNFPKSLDDCITNQSALFNFSNIDFFLELNQLVLDENANYFLHVDPLSIRRSEDTRKKVENACSDLNKISDGYIAKPNFSWPLPPSSLQMFLKSDPTLAGAVITNHKTEYNNRFYNSFLDSPDKFNKETAIKSIVTLAKSVAQFVVGRTFAKEGIRESDLNINVTIVNMIAECFWGWPSWNCSAIASIIDSIADQKMANALSRIINEAPQQRTYMSVNSSRVRFFVTYMMSYLLGDRVSWTNKTNDVCKDTSFVETSDQAHSYMYMKDIFNPNSSENLCVISTVFASKAKSPAFEIDDYDFSSGVYSTWTESLWTDPRLRLFMKSSPTWEGGVFGVGLVVLIVSLVVCFFLNKGSETLFASNVVAL